MSSFWCKEEEEEALRINEVGCRYLETKRSVLNKLWTIALLRRRTINHGTSHAWVARTSTYQRATSSFNKIMYYTRHVRKPRALIHWVMYDTAPPLLHLTVLTHYTWHDRTLGASTYRWTRALGPFLLRPLAEPIYCEVTPVDTSFIISLPKRMVNVVEMSNAVFGEMLTSAGSVSLREEEKRDYKANCRYSADRCGQLCGGDCRIKVNYA